MQKQKWRKSSNLMLVAILFLSIFTPIVPPLNAYIHSNENIVHAAENEKNYLSVAEALKLDNDGSEQSLTGYIVGHVSGGSVTSDPAKFSDDYSFALADKADETNKENMIFVQVKNQDFRDRFGLQSNPDLLGEKVNVTGLLEKYHSHNGLKEPSAMDLDSDD